MFWFLLWAALVIGAGAVLFVLGRRLFRQMKALAADLGVASDRLAEVTDRLGALEMAQEAAVSAGPDSVGSRSQRPRP